MFRQEAGRQVMIQAGRQAGRQTRPIKRTINNLIASLAPHLCGCGVVVHCS